jgi:uncharacterized protein
VLDAIAAAEAELTRLSAAADVPDEPDRRWVDSWLHRSYLEYWAASETAASSARTGGLS